MSQALYNVVHSVLPNETDRSSLHRMQIALSEVEKDAIAAFEM